MRWPSMWRGVQASRSSRKLPVSRAIAFLFFLPCLFATPTALADSVVFLRMEERAKEIFSAWPPGPLDYAVTLRNLKALEPAALVIAPVPHWSAISPLEERSLLRQAQGIDLIFGLIADANPVQPAEGAWLDKLPRISDVEGATDSLPSFTGFSSAPQPALWERGLVAWTHMEFGPKATFQEGYLEAPLLARAHGHVLPSLPLLAALRARQIPLDRVSVSLGQDIRYEDSWRIPIDEVGRVRVPWPAKFDLAKEVISRILPSSLEEGPPREAKEAMQGKLIILGEDESTSKQATPGGSAMSPHETLAYLADALARQSYFVTATEVSKQAEVTRPQVDLKLIAPPTTPEAIRSFPWLAIGLVSTVFLIGLLLLSGTFLGKTKDASVSTSPTNEATVEKDSSPHASHQEERPEPKVTETSEPSPVDPPETIKASEREAEQTSEQASAESQRMDVSPNKEKPSRRPRRSRSKSR